MPKERTFSFPGWFAVVLIAHSLAAPGLARPPAEDIPSPAEHPKPLTRDDILGRGGPDFNGRYTRGMRWLDDGRHYLHRRGGEIKRIDAISGEVSRAYDADGLARALRIKVKIDEQTATRLARSPAAWTSDRGAVLISYKSDLYFYVFATGHLKKLNPDNKPRRAVDLASNGAALSFVRDQNLYVIATATGAQRQLTHGGSETLLNGVLDWVYQEEIYGRGDWQGSWWHPEAKYLAYLQLDESDVPIYSLVDYMPLYAEVERTRYPKPGQPNPTVRLGVAELKTGHTAWVDLSKYVGGDILITQVTWSPNGELFFTVQDREQRWLDLNEADPKTGRIRTLIREISPAWTRGSAPYWLDDRTFLWLSERDGYRHIYHYDADGRLLSRVTTGDWPVDAIIGYDEDAAQVYFTGSRETVLETQAYRVKMGGDSDRIFTPECLTEAGYSHEINFDPTLTFFFDTYSSSTTPRQVALRNSDGSPVRMISENHPDDLDRYLWIRPENLQIPNRAGFPMDVQIIRPPNFESSKRYPVFCPVYGGPGARSVSNSWRGSHQLFEQYLAQQGYIIWRADPYSCSGSVAVANWQAYCRLGENELADLEDSLNWLIDQGPRRSRADRDHGFQLRRVFRRLCLNA